MKTVTINQWCKSCGICAAFCPAGVFDFHTGAVPVIARPEACTGCRQCEIRCPDFAISVEVTKE